MADITRAEVASLIAEEYAPQLFKSAFATSAALSAFPHYNMGTKVNNIPVLATLPEAAWVGDTDNTGIKPTSQATWANKTLVAEEIAVIIAVHENTVDDATEDVLDEIAGLGGQAIGKTIDQAVFLGINKPASWTSLDLLAAATAADQVFEYNEAAGVDDLFGALNQSAESLDDVGLDPTALIGRSGLRFKLGNLRGSDGHLLLSGDAFNGLDTTWVKNGALSANRDDVTAFVADPSRVRIGVRQDITVKFLDQATITGVGNLAEKDMVALRFKARFAYVLGTAITSEGVSAVPVAVAAPSGS